jgi:isocitrate dehydrogenase (NAD+)
MIPGTGIGPELMKHVQDIFHFTGIPVDFEIVETDPSMVDTRQMDNIITSVKRNGVAIKGNIEAKMPAPGELSRNVLIRNELDLFMYCIHVQSWPIISSRFPNVDLLIVRQNIEGEYSMKEHENVPGVIESLKIITRPNSRRLAKFAFQHAINNTRRKVTIVHKANIMKLSDGLFLETCREVGQEFADRIKTEDMIIDNCCMQLASRPTQFDVMLMPNLYGTIVTNVACGLIGGAGLVSGCNYSSRGYAMFEPGTRNSGTALAGKNIANPVAMLHASTDMLEHLGLRHYATILRSAIQKTIVVDRVCTKDIGGQNSTTEMIDAIKNRIESEAKLHDWSEPDKPRLVKKPEHRTYQV